MESINNVPVSSDPRTWDIVTKLKTRKASRYRDRGGVWFAQMYIGISDDMYEYLRKPAYVYFREHNNDIAAFVCDKDHDGALEVHGPSVSTCKDFFHVYLSKRLIGQMRTGRRMHMIYKRMIGYEPYFLVEDAFKS